MHSHPWLLFVTVSYERCSFLTKFSFEFYLLATTILNIHTTAMPRLLENIYTVHQTIETMRTQHSNDSNTCTLLVSVSHVGKYKRADDQPKLAMLAIDIGPMIDRGLHDNCGSILTLYIGPKIAPDDLLNL